MSDRKPRRFFWFEGVTRAEVERSLNDTRPSVLRRQAPRRQLVAATALMTAALALSIFIPQVKVQSYAEIALLAGVGGQLVEFVAVVFVEVDEAEVALADGAMRRRAAAMVVRVVPVDGAALQQGLMGGR